MSYGCIWDYEEKCDEPISIKMGGGVGGYIPRAWSHNPISADCIMNWFALHWIFVNTFYLSSSPFAKMIIRSIFS